MTFNDDSARVFPSRDKPRCSKEDRSTKVEGSQHFFFPELNFQQTRSITAALKCFICLIWYSDQTQKLFHRNDSTGSFSKVM